MNIRSILGFLLALTLTAACTTPVSPTFEAVFPDSVDRADPSDPILAPTETIAEVISEPIELEAQTSSQSEIVQTDCPSVDVIPIGQSIADEYETASYEQVMTWFCDGAEFEDILVALETETLTETTADEMLQMLANDFTWNEIWQLLGLTE